MSTDKDKQASNQMWGGRFASGPDAIMEEINASIDFDRKLYAQDIRGSLAHAAMLAKTGIISAEDCDKITHGLNTILSEIEEGRFVFSRQLEDIHMNIESRLAELIGPAAGRLHTARSRNDQVALDFRLWVKEELGRTDAALTRLITAFLDKAEHPCRHGHAGVHPPADGPARHLRPSLHGLCRDVRPRPLAGPPLHRTAGRKPDRRGGPCRHRFSDRSRPDRQGTRVSRTHPQLHRHRFGPRFRPRVPVTGFNLCGSHVTPGRGNRHLVDAPIRFVRLSDAFSTGSSIMPQKKNPDAAELVRAKTGRINGSLVALLTVMKGLPLAYSKDMQEDKEQVFDAASRASSCRSQP
jgi:argininosuccinate lyase